MKEITMYLKVKINVTTPDDADQSEVEQYVASECAYEFKLESEEATITSHEIVEVL